MAETQRKNLSRLSLFSGSILAMAFSMLSVIVLLIWWQKLISTNLENQYRFFKSQVMDEATVSDDLKRLIQNQDEKLAGQIFPEKGSAAVTANAPALIEDRLRNRQKMVLYEQTFFILLLLSGHIFFLYIYYRERLRRKQTEETVLLATHELRQPLQALSLALETIAPQARGASLKAIESGLRDISKLSELIRYLAGTFAQSGKTGAAVRIDDFEIFFSTFLKQEFDKSKATRVTATFAPHRSLRLFLTPELFHFLLRNLLENALKYASGKVEVFTEMVGKNFTLRIANSGATIHPVEFRKIGGIFYRSTATEVQNTTGFGLGLYLCGRIARKAKGRLIIEHDGSGRTVAGLTLRSR
jgi:signal transduction histidine kinase